MRQPGLSVLRGKPLGIMLLFCVLLTGYFYSSVQRISSGVILPHLGKTFNFSAALIGFLSSLFFYTYGCTQNVWGAISDRVGPLRSCAVGMAMAAVGSALLLIAPTPLLIGLSRILCGLGLAAFFTGIYIYAALAFPVSEYPFWVGFVQVVGNLGTVAAVAPLGMLMDGIGYRGVFAVFTAWALCVSSVLWIFRNREIAIDTKTAQPPARNGISAIARETWADVKLGYQFIARQRSLSLVVFTWSIVSAAVITLQGLWGVSWIAVSSGATEEAARFWTTWVSAGLVVGAVCGSRVALKSADIRKGMLLIVLPLSLAWLLYILCSWAGCPARVLGAIGFVIGVASSSCMVFSISTVKSLVPISRAGLAIGTGQMLLYVAVIVVQWSSGMIINLFPGTAQGTYRNDGFTLAFGGVVLLIWLSAFLTWKTPALATKTPAETEMK